MTPLAAIAVAFAAGLGPPPTAPPECPAPVRFYVLWFGSNMPAGGWLRPAKTHTWATYVRAAPGPGGRVALDAVTVSWYPADGRINVVRPFKAERGVNLDLHATLGVVLGHGEKVKMWGPFETDAGRYEAAVAQAARLASGAVRYRGLDLVRRPGTSHCVHAVTDAVPAIAGTNQNGRQPGQVVTAKLVRRQAAAGGLVAPAVTHDWLVAALGLDRYPIARAR